MRLSHRLTSGPGLGVRGFIPHSASLTLRPRLAPAVTRCLPQGAVARYLTSHLQAIQSPGAVTLRSGFRVVSWSRNLAIVHAPRQVSNLVFPGAVLSM
jgi:hypothetical protein